MTFGVLLDPAGSVDAPPLLPAGRRAGAGRHGIRLTATGTAAFLFDEPYFFFRQQHE
jgi:hypothetical protein